MFYQIYLLLYSKVVAVSHLVHCKTLLQNATDIIIKCVSFFIRKCDKRLLQKISATATVLLQNQKVITKCDVFIKKLRQLQQNASVQCIFKTASVHHSHMTMSSCPMWISYKTIYDKRKFRKTYIYLEKQKMPCIFSNTVCFSLSRGHQTITIMIHYCYCLMVSEMLRSSI